MQQNLSEKVPESVTYSEKKTLDSVQSISGLSSSNTSEIFKTNSTEQDKILRSKRSIDSTAAETVSLPGTVMLIIDFP